MKRLLILAFLVTFGLGIAARRIAKSDSNPENVPARSTATENLSGRSPDRPAKTLPARPAPLPEAAEERSRTMESLAEDYRRRLLTLASFWDELLKLDPAQKETLNAAIDVQMDEIRMQIRNAGPSTGQSGETIGTGALAAKLVGILNTGQQATFLAYKAQQVEAAASQSLVHLEDIFELEEGQRDQVYRIFEKAAAASQKKDDAPRGLSEILEFCGGIDGDPFNLGIEDLLTLSIETSVGSAADKSPSGVLREKMEKRIEDKVNEFVPTLNQSQLDKFRENLRTLYLPETIGERTAEQ